MTIAEKLITLAGNEQTIAENQQRVYEAGKAQRDYEWWDYYQKKFNNTPNEAERTNYLYAFAGQGWKDDNYQPVRPIMAHESSSNMFSYSLITDTKVTIDLAFTVASASNVITAFANATKLKTIRKLVVNEKNVMKNHFTNCTALENIVIEGVIGKTANFQWCPLTRASIESVVAALSDTVADQTVTFKSSAVNNAFTTEEWDAVVTSKPNWTFALVE